jgi:hypothetical protein
MRDFVDNEASIRKEDLSMQPTTTASFSPAELKFVLFKAEDGKTYRVTLEKHDPCQLLYDRYTQDLPPSTLLAIDREDRAFRLGSFDGNGVDGGDPTLEARDPGEVAGT